jgi:hypothetical protein
MNLKLFVFIGAVAAGWTWSGGYAQALEYAQDRGGAGPSERAQVPGVSDNIGRSAPDEGGGVGPSGQTSQGVPRTNGMDTLGNGRRDLRIPQQGAETGMQIDPGRGGLPGPGSAGSTLGGGGTNPLGPTSGGGSSGMAPSSGMGGSAGGMSSGGGR